MKKLLPIILSLALLTACDSAKKAQPTATPEDVDKAVETVTSGKAIDSSNYSKDQLEQIETAAKEQGVKVEFKEDGTTKVTTDEGVTSQVGNTWPTNDFAKQVPPPTKGEITEADSDDKWCGITVKMTIDEARAYGKQLEKAGFTINANSQDNVAEDYYSYDGTNENGYTVSIMHYNGALTIDIFKLEW